VSSTEAGGGSGKRRQLGRGLSSLLGDDDDDLAPADRQRQTRAIPIGQIQPGASQPRTTFDEDELEALAQSIRERGVLQPILSRRLDDETFEIIAGERRWRAAQRAQLHEIPALVREFTDTEALEVALIENVQRSDLTPLEEAQGYQRLIDEYEHTQENIAQVVGKSRSHVANTLRLLALSPAAREYLEAGRLTAGHARALLASPDADRLADYVVAGGLSVRATEKLVQSQAEPSDGGSGAADGKQKTPRRTKSSPQMDKDPDTIALEQSLTETLGLVVEIAARDVETGALTIHYQSLEQLDDLLAKLTESAPGPVPAPGAAFQAEEDDDVFEVEDDEMGDGPAGDQGEALDIVEIDVVESGPVQDDAPAAAAEEDAPATDFDALLAQTESMLTTGAMGDLGPEEAEDDADAPDEGENAGALVGSILDALDLGDDDAPGGSAGEGDDVAFYIDEDDEEKTS